MIVKNKRNTEDRPINYLVKVRLQADTPMNKIRPLSAPAYVKLRRPLVAASRPSHGSGVEIADDVILLDRRGRRISPPDYAVRPIDKSPRAQKRRQELEDSQGGR